MGKILYIQYANPAAYPPVEHGSHILSELGWFVRFLGVHSEGPGSLEFPKHPNMEVEVMPYNKPGFMQKLAYARFLLKAVTCALWWRPDWIYVSDPMATPAGQLLKYLRFRVIYHEHDSPSLEACPGGFMRRIYRSRRSLACISDLNILPQRQRVDQFVKEINPTHPPLCVWNCPPRADAMNAINRQRQPDEALGVYFHGSINLERVPLTLIEGAALSGVPVCLRIVGYETIGSQGSLAQLIDAAVKAGPNVTLELPGPVSRHLLRNQMDGMHAGWINCRNLNDDWNLKHLVGASVKAFDYLAAGLPLIISDNEDWRSFYETPGYARSCDVNDANSIAATLRWLYDNPVAAAVMGIAGRQRILNSWNYEIEFEPVIKRIFGSVSDRVLL